MTRRTPEGEPDARRPPEPVRTNYAGAVYGSMLAASVVAGAGIGSPFPRIELVVLLLATGVVFWAAHVYAHVVGESMVHRALTRAEISRVCAAERPILGAAVPPAAAVAISPLLGLGFAGTAWLALGVAVAEQVGWASAVLVRAGIPLHRVVAAGVVNLLLGLVIVVVKAVLQH
ncbi:hypothetical protein ACGF12_38550 [Kitasatospora sp. NPDC048296]|uniref:hypothetical protein n=1 Tax=Kitasatospora sp. NPDC048296 TaxID=3364048 RepID=UPI0037147690